MRHRDDEDDEFDEDDDDSAETMPCPYCLAAVYDDAERCPRCGQYLSREDAPRRPSPLVAVGVAICLVIVARWIFWF